MKKSTGINFETLKQKFIKMFNDEILNEIGEILIKKRWSISAAESVTAGLLQAAFSTVKDASKFFQGGITAYNVGQKCRHLLVEPLHAIEHNSVSLKVAEDMSRQACYLFTSTFGLSLTGYASKMAEKNINELFAYYSVAKEGHIICSGKINVNADEGLPAQLDYVNQLTIKLHNLIADKTQ